MHSSRACEWWSSPEAAPARRSRSCAPSRATVSCRCRRMRSRRKSSTRCGRSGPIFRWSTATAEGSLPICSCACAPPSSACCEEPGTYWTDQFHNADAITGYMGIGRELVEQTGGTLHTFCGAVGTAGMLAGVSKALKAAGCAARIVALEPASSPTLTTGKGGAHRVEGIAPGFVPPHLAAGRLRRSACRAGRRGARDGSPSRA